MREKSFKGRDTKDINRGDKSNAGKRDDTELALEGGRTKTKQGGKGEQILLGSTIEGQQSGLINNRGYRKIQMVIRDREHRVELGPHAHAGE